jgi:hypothetical protein
MAAAGDPLNLPQVACGHGVHVESELLLLRDRSFEDWLDTAVV